MDFDVLGNYRLTFGLPTIRESARDGSSRNAACDHFSEGIPTATGPDTNPTEMS